MREWSSRHSTELVVSVMAVNTLSIFRHSGKAPLLCLLGVSGALLGGCETTAVAPLSPPPAPVHSAPPPAPAPNTQVYVYPTGSQTSEQLDRDRYECHAWAVKQSHFDPSETRVAPHQRVQVVAMPPRGSDVPAGAATGAILGAVVSHPHDAGAGAVIGAIAGAVVGAASDSSREQQVEAIRRTREERDEQVSASMEQQAAGYRRAIGACLEGRGYTVK